MHAKAPLILSDLPVATAPGGCIDSVILPPVIAVVVVGIIIGSEAAERIP